jgi:uncharacterized protein YgbK (DUF1537 family)
MLLGAIADDFTGATDLGDTLVRAGMRTTVLTRLPEADAPRVDAEAVVLALKIRTAPQTDAIRQSGAALRWLEAGGAAQIFFKYCSTFDSTNSGNIGPIADALLAALGERFTIACPAFPENGRTVYLGHLFVGDRLLSESPMRHHPLTPMTDSNLVRVLQRQTSGRVALVPYPTVARGAAALGEAFGRLRNDGCRYAVVDAVDGRNLDAIGEACAALRLVTGSAGVARGLPTNFARRGFLRLTPPERPPVVGGCAAVIAGSCADATLAQVAAMRARHPALAIDPRELAAGDAVDRALSWASARLLNGPILIYTSAPPDRVASVQAELGPQRAAALVERGLTEIARGLVALGVRRLIVAGGETAGAIVQGLGVGALDIGPRIAPGVPWTLAAGDPPIALALKSGNFGAPEFFAQALEAIS